LEGINLQDTAAFEEALCQKLRAGSPQTAWSQLKSVPSAERGMSAPNGLGLSPDLQRRAMREELRRAMQVNKDADCSGEGRREEVLVGLGRYDEERVIYQGRGWG